MKTTGTQSAGAPTTYDEAAEPAAPRGGETRGPGKYHTHALTRGLVVLEVLADGPQPMTLARIHDASGLPKSTLVRLLAALCEEEFLVRVDDQPSYRLGHKVLDVANAYLDVLDITEVAAPALQALADASRQTANLGVRDGASMLHVAVGSPRRTLRFDAAVGDRAPLHATSLGKALLAGMLDAEVLEILGPGPYEPLSTATITDADALLADLRAVRERGWSLDDNEHSEGLTCLAVNIPHDGRVLGALSVSGPSGEMGPEVRDRMVQLLRDAVSTMTADPELVHALAHLSTLSDRPA